MAGVTSLLAACVSPGDPAQVIRLASRRLCQPWSSVVSGGLAAVLSLS